MEKSDKAVNKLWSLYLNADDPSHGSVANFVDDIASVELVSSLPSQLDELLKRPEFGRELTFADHVDQFYACQGRCG